MIGNGGQIGQFNLSTRKSANGVWTPNEIAARIEQDIWPTAQDPLFSSVALLCLAPPVLNQQNPVDEGALAGWDVRWIAQNTAGSAGRISSCSNPPFPQTPYMYLTASTSAAILFSRSTSYVLGTQDFTIEFWVVFNNALAAANIFDMRTGAGSVIPTIDITGAGKVLYLVSAVTKITSSGTITVNTPYHIAYTRTGSVGTLWINGVSNGTWADTTNYAGTTAIYWMGSLFGNAQGGAFYDCLRITNGTAGSGAARYTAPFTPPTQRFPVW